MNKSEAIIAMLKGNKIRHRYFDSNEYVMMIDENTVQFEDGVKQSSFEFWSIRQSGFWDNDWEIITE